MFIEQTAPAEAYSGEDVTIIINLTNLGSGEALGALSGYDDTITIPHAENKVFEKKLKFEKEGTYILDKSNFNYTFGGRKAKAYSNELTITIKNQSLAQIEEKGSSVDNRVTDVAPANETKQQPNLFTRIFLWVKGLFVK